MGVVSINFNLRCLHEKVIPSGYKINFKSNNPAESYTIRKAGLVLINNRIKQSNKKISKLWEEITQCKRKIKNSTNNKTFLHPLHGFIFHSQDKVFKTTKAKQVKKKKQLINHVTSKTTTTSRQPDDDKMMENGSTTSPANHLLGHTLLQKGPK